MLDRHRRRYTWSITFTSNPGAFPAGAGNVAALEADVSSLTGTNATAAVDTIAHGVDALGGEFQLGFTTNGTSFLYTDAIPHNADGAEVHPARLKNLLTKRSSASPSPSFRSPRS